MEEQAKLLAECLDVLETIQCDGWIIRGQTAKIAKMIPQLRRAVYPVIPVVERSITFRCSEQVRRNKLEGECGEIIEAIKPETTEGYQYITCAACGNGYRVYWQDADNSETHVIPNND